MKSENRRLPAVRCIPFHEKAFKLKMKFISLLCYKMGVAVGIGLPCGLANRSMFRSKLPQKGGTLPSGYRSRSISRFHAMHRNRSGSSVLLLAIEAGSREKVGRVVGSSTN